MWGLCQYLVNGRCFWLPLCGSVALLLFFFLVVVVCHVCRKSDSLNSPGFRCIADVQVWFGWASLVLENSWLHSCWMQRQERWLVWNEGKWRKVLSTFMSYQVCCCWHHPRRCRCCRHFRYVLFVIISLTYFTSYSLKSTFKNPPIHWLLCCSVWSLFGVSEVFGDHSHLLHSQWRSLLTLGPTLFLQSFLLVSIIVQLWQGLAFWCSILFLCSCPEGS